MKGRHILILLVLVAIVGAIGLFVHQRSQSEWVQSAAPPGAKVLDFPINDVARVVIRGKDGQINLAKKSDVWVVEEKADYPANFERTSRLLRELWELHPVQELNIGQSQFARLELVEPGQSDKPGTVVELKDKNGKTLAKLVAGKQNMRTSEGPRQFPIPMGRYVLAPQTGKVALVNHPLDVDAKPESWVKRDFVKINNPSSITLSGQTPEKHWTLTRSDAKADWKLADAKPNEELDKTTTISLATVLSSSTFADVLPLDAKPDEYGLDKPDVLTIQTFDGFTYLLKIGKAESNNYAVAVSVSANLVKDRSPAPEEKPEEKAKNDQEFDKKLKDFQQKAASEKGLESRIYLVPKFTLDPFLKDRMALLAKPTATPSPSLSASPTRNKS